MYDYLKPIDDGLQVRDSGPWAQAKLDYLNRYINVFETSMRNKWPRRNYIDLLAGPGKNRIRETGEILLGSPLLALTTQFPFTSFYFVDKDPDNVSALTTRASASALVSHVKTYTGDCNVVVNDIVAELKRVERESLNLAFLDPEGLELSWATVSRLASIKKMDLIINYPRVGLSRFMKKAAESELDTGIDRYFGDRTWRDLYKEHQRASHFPLHRHLINMYKEKLKTLGYEEVRLDDELGDEPLMRNKKQAPLYHLLFASKSSLGVEFWRAVTKRDVYGQKRLFDSY